MSIAARLSPASPARFGPAMTRRDLWLSAGLVVLLGGVARFLVAASIIFPKPEDTAYYVDVARGLIAGHGLVSNAVWSYASLPVALPHPAFDLWLPLPSLLAAVPMALFGPSFGAAQLSSIAVGLLLPVLALRLGADLAEERGLSRGRARTLALGSGLTAALSLPLLLYAALPDSTAPFAALVLAAACLIPRIRRAALAGGAATIWLVALGALIGLALLTRNEGVYLAGLYAVLMARLPLATRPRLRLVVLPALVAALFYGPWLIRDALVLGSPLPGGALANALSNSPADIFAYAVPPTLARHLALGPLGLADLALGGLAHNLFSVLVLPGLPLSLIGLAGLPGLRRSLVLRPIMLMGLVTFLVTSLVFPVATTWGTFLHASGAIAVLLIVAGLDALDRLVAALGRRRHWTRPTAWLSAVLAVAGAALFSAALLPSFGAASASSARLFGTLGPALARAAGPGDAGPVLTDAPVWLPYATGRAGLVIPHEPVASTIELAHRLGAHLVVVTNRDNAVFLADAPAGCLAPLDLTVGLPPAEAAALAGVQAFRLAC